MADEMNLENEGKELTVEELQARIDALMSDNEKLKKAQSNASSDAAKWKKELQSRMSEAEQKTQAEAEEKQRLIDRVAELEKAQNEAQGIASFMSLGTGMTNDLAKECTTAFLNNDLSALLANVNKYVAERDRVLTAESVRNTPTPHSGNGGSTITKADFNKMGYTERAELYAKDPELYKSLNS